MRRVLQFGFYCWLGLCAVQAQYTEVPSTAPREGLLLEMDLISLATHRATLVHQNVESASISVGAILLSKGVTEQLDLQFGFELWHEEKETVSGATQSVSGQGDGWLRMKWNFSGDESKGAAWAILPYLKLPLADGAIGNGSFEPGVALAHGQPLPNDSAFNATLGWDILDDGAGGRDHVIYASAALTGNLSERFAVYGELGGAVDLASSQDWTTEIGAGVIYAFNERGWVDLAVYTGLTDSSADFTPVLRCGWQF